MTDRRLADGDCFEVAGRIAANGLRTDEHRTLTNFTVCHALVMHPEGFRHWHAWIEVTETVNFPQIGPVPMVIAIDKSNGNDTALPVALTYKIAQVEHDDVRRYTADEACALMLRTGHFGPWEE